MPWGDVKDSAEIEPRTGLAAARLASFAVPLDGRVALRRGLQRLDVAGTSCSAPPSSASPTGPSGPRSRTCWSASSSACRSGPSPACARWSPRCSCGSSPCGHSSTSRPRTSAPSDERRGARRPRGGRELHRCDPGARWLRLHRPSTPSPTCCATRSASRRGQADGACTWRGSRDAGSACRTGAAHDSRDKAPSRGEPFRAKQILRPRAQVEHQIREAILRGDFSPGRQAAAGDRAGPAVRRESADGAGGPRVTRRRRSDPQDPRRRRRQLRQERHAGLAQLDAERVDGHDRAAGVARHRRADLDASGARGARRLLGGRQPPGPAGRRAAKTSSTARGRRRSTTPTSWCTTATST